MMNQTIYCRVIDSKVAEYPVSLATITRRKHPKNWYTPTIEVDVPTTGRKDVKTVSFEVRSNVVKVFKSWRPYTVQESFILFLNADGSLKEYADVSQEDATFVTTLVADHFEAEVQKLANARGYNSIDTAIGRYSNSNIETYKREADFIKESLESVWRQLIEYYQNLALGSIPLPRNLNDVALHVVVPTWSE